MGCGASAGPKEATPDQKEEMAKACVKECCAICAQSALDQVNSKQKSIKIKAPGKELEQVRALPDQLKEAASKTKSEAGKAGDDVAEQLKGSAQGGMFSGLASAVGAGAQIVSGAVGGGAASAIDALAETVQAGITKLDAEFEKVGNELCAKERAAIVQAFNTVITEAEFKKCLEMVRQNPTPDGCTKAFMVATEQVLVPKLLATESVKDAINKSGCVSAWKSCIENTNKATAKIAEVMGGEKQATTGFDFDIEAYIAKQLVQELSTIMGERELKIREDKGKDVSKLREETFPLLFGGDTITEVHYASFQKGK